VDSASRQNAIEQSSCADIPASDVKCLVQHFGNDPVFLLKAFENEEYALQTNDGTFWASSIKSIRENTAPGRGDPNESVAPYIGWWISDTEAGPFVEKQIQYLFERNDIDRINSTLGQCSIICFYGIHLENCVVGKMDDGEEYLFLRVEKHFQEFGSRISDAMIFNCL
jgi:hypothetical protein